MRFFPTNNTWLMLAEIAATVLWLLVFWYFWKKNKRGQ